MKRFFLAALAVAAVMMNNEGSAQKGFSLSVKATPQISSLQNEDDNDNSILDRKATFNGSFGIGAGYNFTERLGFGTDVLYSLQGQRYKINGVEINQRVNYVKIPLYLSYNGDASKPISFIGKFGPQVSILANSKVTDKDDWELNPDTKDRYKDITFGAMASAGAQFRLDKKLFLFTTTRFDYDFTNAEDDSYRHYPSGRATTYNMTAGLEIGFKYLLR
jgi:Outer membrane protein beta-barrel domain